MIRPVILLHRSLMALLILGIPPASAQEPMPAKSVPVVAATSHATDAVAARTWGGPCQDGQLLPAKHIDPQLPAAKPAAAQDPVPAKQVLIATESSRFKEAVATQVAETLCQDKRPLLVKHIDLSRLTAEPIQDYQVIVLLNSCRAWRPSSAVREFLKTLSDVDKKKLVVVTTANSGECVLDVGGVDAISAASKRTGIAAVSQTVVDKLRARLAAP
jgi:hypothetical protein